MLRSIAKRAASRGLGRLLPVARLIAVAEIALLARRHAGLLTKKERRRLLSLVRRGRRLTPKERLELRALAARLEPKAFAWGAIDRVSPVPLPNRLTKPRPR